MRVLRASVWVMMKMPPLTTVTRESDLELSIEETVEALIRGPEPLTVEVQQSGAALVTHEVFEMPDAELEAAIPEAMRRFQERQEDEDNMATLYHWNGDHMGPPLRGDGTVMNPAPAPLSAEDIEIVFEQLKLHPNYRRQRMVTTSRDGVTVEMRDGKITSRRALR